MNDVKRDVQAFLERGGTSIVIYGIGQAEHFDALKKWLESSPKHHLVYLEDALKKSFSHPQVSFALFGEPNPQVFAKLTNDFYFLPHPNYRNKSEKVYPWLLQEVYAVQAYLSDLWLHEEQANFYHHLACLDEYSPSMNRQAKVPFLICGAGPSLEDHLEILKDHGILLPAGTAMNILNDAGIDADLGVAFDGKKSGARRLQSNSAFRTPFFVDLDSSAKYLNGPKFLTKQPNLASWKNRILEALGINEQLMEIGPSITSTHYAINLALSLGSPSITLLGVDLAYLKGKQYAGKKTWLLDEDVLTPLESRKDLIWVVGKDYQTSRTYYQEALIYSQMDKVKFYEGVFPKREKLDLPYQPFNIPLFTIRNELLAWKKELETSPKELLKGYLDRFTLIEEANQHKIDQFCQKVVQVHLKAIDEALLEIEEKLVFPATQDEVKAELPYNAGKLDGLVRLFYDNGQVKNEIAYSEGHRNGIYRYYSRSGKLLEEGNYRMGVPFGLYQQWNRKGYLEKKIISHLNGVFDLTEWNEKGDIIKEVKSGLLFANEAKEITDLIRRDLEQDF